MAKKVLVIVGSESGTAKRGIKLMMQKWPGAGKDFVLADTKDGNTIGADLASLKEYDVVLISTSSYGEGDPPDNYVTFFEALQKAAASGEKPLEGLQHAVLGWGSSVYDTFQNCPRLSDKYLGECGSRRIAQRAELDESADDEQVDQPMYKKFSDEVSAALKSLPAADAAPACDWTSPASKILVHSGSAAGAGVGVGAILAVVVAAGAGYYYYTTQM